MPLNAVSALDLRFYRMFYFLFLPTVFHDVRYFLGHSFKVIVVCYFLCAMTDS